jgi:hypothetical protein
MEQLQEWIPIEYLIVAAVVLSLLFVLTLAFRALAGRGSGQESSRLAVSEFLEVDKNRRLVLVRRDDVEHLVLIGGGQDVVVESAIRPGVQRRGEAPAAARVMPGDDLEPEQEPAAARRPQKRDAPGAAQADTAGGVRRRRRRHRSLRSGPNPGFDALASEDKSREA